MSCTSCSLFLPLDAMLVQWFLCEYVRLSGGRASWIDLFCVECNVAVVGLQCYACRSLCYCLKLGRWLAGWLTARSMVVPYWSVLLAAVQSPETLPGRPCVVASVPYLSSPVLVRGGRGDAVCGPMSIDHGGLGVPEIRAPGLSRYFSPSRRTWLLSYTGGPVRAESHINGPSEWFTQPWAHSLSKWQLHLHAAST